MAGDDAPAPSATLHAVHKHINIRCGGVSDAFLACKSGNANPEACVKQGDAVTSCVVALCVIPRRSCASCGGALLWRQIRGCWQSVGLPATPSTRKLCAPDHALSHTRGAVQHLELHLPVYVLPRHSLTALLLVLRASMFVPLCRLRDAGAKAGKELDQYSGCLDYNRCVGSCACASSPLSSALG
jgi:hypothetical protein